jgi:hypothetical protein
VGLQSRKQGTHWRTPSDAEASATDRDHANGLESKRTVADAARLFDLHPSTVGQLLAASIQSESSSQDSGGCRREFFITIIKGLSFLCSRPDHRFEANKRSLCPASTAKERHVDLVIRQHRRQHRARRADQLQSNARVDGTKFP